MKYASLKKKKNLCSQLKKVGFLILQYGIATSILLIFYSGFFDLKSYILHMLNFSIQEPYYFLVFFIQLSMLSPLLISWCEFCDSRKMKFIWHIATILFLCWCSSLFIQYTYILPVHGGGQYLFGGTFIIPYYLGILFADLNLFNKTILQRILIAIFAVIGWFFWWLMSSYQKFPFDTWLASYYGDGFNPPSFQFIIFAIITLFLFYALFTLMEDFSNIFFEKIIIILKFLGKYTLYIFMYHLLVRDIIGKCFPYICENQWALRICMFFPMIVIPALVVYMLQKIAYKIKEKS